MYELNFLIVNETIGSVGYFISKSVKENLEFTHVTTCFKVNLFWREVKKGFFRIEDRFSITSKYPSSYFDQKLNC